MEWLHLGAQLQLYRLVDGATGAATQADAVNASSATVESTMTDLCMARCPYPISPDAMIPWEAKMAGVIDKWMKTWAMVLGVAALCNLPARQGYAQQPGSGSRSCNRVRRELPARKLPLTTSAVAPPRSKADVEFMQGMIMHHAQAVEMTALIASHTGNKDLRMLGARISSSQSDEIKFMKRWLATRGEPLSMAMAGMPDMDAVRRGDGTDAGNAHARNKWKR